jgi:hypothetical protein
LGANLGQKLFDAYVIRSLKEGLHDEPALIGRAQAALDHVVMEQRTEML